MKPVAGGNEQAMPITGALYVEGSASGSCIMDPANETRLDTNTCDMCIRWPEWHPARPVGHSEGRGLATNTSASHRRELHLEGPVMKQELAGGPNTAGRITTHEDGRKLNVHTRVWPKPTKRFVTNRYRIKRG